MTEKIFKYPGEPGLDKHSIWWESPYHAFACDPEETEIKSNARRGLVISERVCDECGELFYVNRNHHPDQTLCSKRCAGRQGGRPAFPRVTVVCKHCGKDFRSIPCHHRQFCSGACHHQYQRDNRKPPKPKSPRVRTPMPDPGTTKYHWTVMHQRTDTHFLVRCACGLEVWRNVTWWKRRSKSCGCGGRTFEQVNTPRAFKDLHKMMVRRCHDPSSSGYESYGEKGITVCDRWRDDWRTFMADLSPRPSAGHTLDRIDSSKGYEPANVWWAQGPEQSRVSRVGNAKKSTKEKQDGHTETV